MPTKATDPGTYNENLITRLDIFLYPDGQTNKDCVFHKRFDAVNKNITATVKLYMVTEDFNRLFPNNNTTCDVFVIANYPGDGDIPGSTDVASLSALQISSPEFDTVITKVDDEEVLSSPDQFVMSSPGAVKIQKAGDSASGSIDLVRMAAKITLGIRVPKYIDVKTGDTYVRWYPVLSQSPIGVDFHNGVMTGCINAQSPEPHTHFDTEKTVSFTEGAAKADNEYYYTCDATFYTYSHQWSQGNQEAPFFNMVMMWQNDEGQSKPYHYQIMINGAYRQIVRNYWYDMDVRIGVLGSEVEASPVMLENEVSYYVYDWSNIENEKDETLQEDVNIREWHYLVIHEHRIEMHNETLGEIHLESSHGVAYALEWPGSMDGLDKLEEYNDVTGKKYAAFYINCSANTPSATDLIVQDRNDANGINKGDFTLKNSNKTSKTIEFEYDINNKDKKIYSPVYIHLKVWLDVNAGGDAPDTTEEKYVDYITLVYYPPIYIIPDESTRWSTYLNNTQRQARSNDPDYEGSEVKLGNHNLGRAPGIRNAGNYQNDYSMYILNVTQIDEKFSFNGGSYDYIIGDPRVRSVDLALDGDNNNNNNVTWANDAEGNKLTYYYPTASDGDSFRVIAPKFRIASFNNASWGAVTVHGAAMRCASIQEDGFPAGRWRLPTVAEVKYVQFLQGQEVILPIFTSGSGGYFSALYANDAKTQRWRFNNDNEARATTGSVRCVYDDWYWGSEREAIENQNRDQNDDNGDEYLFTWGDEPITWGVPYAQRIN